MGRRNGRGNRPGRKSRRHIDEGHEDTRNILRIIGPIIVLIGLGFLAVGVVSFFSAAANHSTPKYFWCAFAGMPLLALGGAICKFAFMGKVARYVANEVAPVGKDAINYMAEGTKDSVRDLAAAVGEGIRGSSPAEPEQRIRCHKCNEDNDITAKFCNNCGVALAKSKECPDCNELNDHDAHFCDNCGKEMV